MSINSVFNRSLDGLTVAQRGLAVAANNIANVNTKGYARQQLLVGSRPADLADLSLAGGAQVLGLDSITSSFIELQLFSTANSYGTVDGRRRTMSQLEELFNDSQNQGLGKSLNDMFNSFSDLANNPSSVPLRQGVRDKATVLAERFNSMSAQLKSMKKDLSSEISTRLTKINSLSSQIASLNQTISQAGGASSAPDQVAQRTYLLRQLSEEVNISSFTDASGNVQVQIGNGGALVSGFDAGNLAVSSDNLNSGGTLAVTVTFAGSSDTMNVTDQITGGRLGGNLIDRNTTLNTELDNLDTLAYQLATQFNAVYATGYGLDGSTGNNFFTPLASSSGAAGALSVDASVVADVRKIAAASQDPSISGVGDNRIALQLASLQNSLTMATGTETFAQFYQGMVGSIGVTAGSVKQDFDVKSNLMNQIEVQRESISGVNMDEEGASILQFQKAFEASSKLMSIANEMLDTLLKI
jgi:flagellar hook-associated protein 1 FlgK